MANSSAQTFNEMADVREDAEQITKFNEIVDLLVAAGYFRARIKGLSDFDKVVGGMTWGIESCNFDVDINFLFHENLTIGQKIAITEKIVVILPKMNCPHIIEPHQIQGLDYIHIFPVIQWILKRTMKARKDDAGGIRHFIEYQFNKIHNEDHYFAPKENKNYSLQCIQLIKLMYNPQRRLKRDFAPKDQVTKLKSTIFEYDSPTIDAKIDKHENKDITSSAEVIPAELGYQQSHIDEDSYNFNIVGNMIRLQLHEEIVNSEYHTSAMSKAEDANNKTKIFETIQKQIVNLKHRIQHFQKNRAKLIDKRAAIENDLIMSEDKQNNIKSNFLQLKKSSCDTRFHKIKALFFIRMSLKTQEYEFRDKCTVDASYLHQTINNMDNFMPKEESCITEYDVKKKSIDKTKLILAKKNRAIASLLRQLDDVPGRSELTQYQRRFMELYSQVSAKHKETKQYYTLYNTLYDTKLYLSKEFTILNSIQNNYKEAMATNAGKEQFLKQLETIILGVQRNKKKIEENYAAEKDKTYNLSKHLAFIIEQQRKYVTAVKQLTVECRKNEALLGRLRTN